MSENKTHWKKVFDSDYLGACDLENDKDIKVVVKHVEVRKIKGQNGTEDERNIAIFTDDKVKPMVLNATNCKQMRKFTGTPFIQEWKNVPIQVYVKKDIKAFGDITEGLRIRDNQPKKDNPALLPTDKKNWDKVVIAMRGGYTIDQIKTKWTISADTENLLNSAVNESV